LATMLTVILEIPHLVGIAAVEHLVNETVIVAGIVARVDVFEAIPVIDKDLCEDVGVLRRCCHHQIVPSKGYWVLGNRAFLPRLTLCVHTLIGLHRGTLTPLSRPADTGISGQMENEFSYTMNKAPWGRTLQHQPLYQGPARWALEAYVPRWIPCPSSLGKDKAQCLAACFHNAG